MKILSWLTIILAILSAALGLKGFLLPNHFFDGGITGVSMFLSEIFCPECPDKSTPLSIIIPIVNLPFIILGYQYLSKSFAYKGIVAIAGLSLCLAFVDFPVITEDKILAAVFGGFFLGTGIGLAVRNNAVLDGTEIMAILVSRKSFLTIGNVIVLFNVIIFTIIGFTIEIEIALYSILTYFVASKSIDFFIHGIEEYNAAIIVSYKSQEIKKEILEDLERGVTIFTGKTGLKERDVEILYCVITRLEIQKLREIVNNIDPKAFIIIHVIDETIGGMTQKKGFKFRSKKVYARLRKMIKS